MSLEAFQVGFQEVVMLGIEFLRCLEFIFSLVLWDFLCFLYNPLRKRERKERVKKKKEQEQEEEEEEEEVGMCYDEMRRENVAGND